MKIIIAVAEFIFLFILTFFHSCSEKGNCVVISRFANGKAKSIRCDFSSDSYMLKDFYPNGVVLTSTPFVKGKIEGTAHSYYENGVLKSKEAFSGNYLNGNSEYYSEKGQLESKCKFKNGVNGSCEHYYKSGSVKSNMNYKNDLRHGMNIYYDEYGRVESLNYCIDDKTVYGRFYNYEKGGDAFTESFEAIVKIMSDTTSWNIELVDFTVELPIPDSLPNSKSLYFRYGVKPTSFRDSFMLKSEKEIPIPLNTVINLRMPVKLKNEVIFYGFIYNKKDTVIYNPYSIQLPTETTKM